MCDWKQQLDGRSNCYSRWAASSYLLFGVSRGEDESLDLASAALKAWHKSGLRSEIRASPAEVRAPLPKAAALIALVVLVDVWLTHHYGWNLEQLVAVGGIAALLSGVLPYVRSALSKTDQRAAARLGRWTLQRALSMPLLVVLWVGFAIAVVTVSSVTVMSETPEGIGTVSVAYPDRAGGKAGSLDETGAVRFHIFTTPLGRPIRVAAPGFVPTSFTLYPFSGLTVRLSEDVPVAPSLLLRPQHNGLVALQNGGTLVVRIAGSGTPGQVIAETSDVQSSFILGEPRAVPPSMVDDWRAELACDIPEVRNPILLAWRRPVALRLLAASPGPRTRLSMEINARNQDLVARTEIVVGNDHFIDVPVFDVKPEPGGCR